jgi:Secretion system C-terminal sorting domain
MKHFTLFFLLSLCTYFASAQVVYVNRAATGANNGTSWANAYTNLRTAMRVTSTVGRQIWVAAGTYRVDTTSGFVMNPGVQLYGGFAGTETALGQRNATTNVTILSGDISGNDTPGNFTTNRTDNALHVIWLTGTDTVSRAVIDGFAIRGGNTAATNATTPAVGRGGGILAVTKVTIRNCTFSDNFGANGAAISASGAGASSILVRDCVFEGNFTNERSLVHYITLRNGDLRRCTFRNNSTGRGCFFADGSRNIVVDSCSFLNNRTTGALLCAGLYVLGATATISNSTFVNNKSASSCGAMWLNGSGAPTLLTTVLNCTFDRDTAVVASGRGGAIYATSGVRAIINGCTFTKNYGGILGGAIGIEGPGATPVAGFPGLVTNVRILNSTMSENSCGDAANGFGGTIFCGFRAVCEVDNCTIEKGVAGNRGGGIHVQNDTSRMVITNSTFRENDGGSGGAVHSTTGGDVSITNSMFAANTAAFGAAMAFSGTKADRTDVSIDRSTLIDNAAETQGGGIDIQNIVTATITNTIFANNIAENGAGISNNASTQDTARLNLIYCTFAGGISAGSPGITQFEDRDSSECILTMQNTILANSGDNYIIEKGRPTVISRGGNLCVDNTMRTLLTGTNDLNNTDPQLVNPDNGNVRLKPTSPCINKGIVVAGITVDRDGVARGTQPDMGAYEFMTISAFEPAKALRIDMSPNPTANQVVLSLNDDTRGTAVVDFFDVTGKLVLELRSEKTAGEWAITQPVSHWTPGIYQVRLRVGDKLYAGALVKE